MLDLVRPNIEIDGYSDDDIHFKLGPISAVQLNLDSGLDPNRVIIVASSRAATLLRAAVRDQDFISGLLVHLEHKLTDTP